MASVERAAPEGAEGDQARLSITKGTAAGPTN